MTMMTTSNARGSGGGAGGGVRWRQKWSQQPLEPLMEGPDPDAGEDGHKREFSSWDVIREWFRTNQHHHSHSSHGSHYSPHGSSNRGDLRLLLSVLGCPLAPIPLAQPPNDDPLQFYSTMLHIKDIPLEKSMAHYIIKQYMAATGCLKRPDQKIHNMYAAGRVRMMCCETEVSCGRASKNVKCVGHRSGFENGSFVVWQMSPGMWSVELAVGSGSGSMTTNNHHHHYSSPDEAINHHHDNKVIAGSDGKIVWRHTPWLGTHAAKGPQRPLRRIIQGLDPKITASLFEKAECMGEKSIGDEECFVLKVAADREAVMERSEGAAEVMRHVLHGYFSQKSGLLIYLEDSHLTRVHVQRDRDNSSGDDDARRDENVYWETTIGSSIGDYQDVDGMLIAHQGKSIATLFRFGELSMQYSRTRMEEVWRIDDVDFNVPGLSLDHFIPPSDIQFSP